ncbi:hypothetical protein ACQKP6_09000 [Pseudomonas fluorescens]|uniref:hypothetical protein n=1 Tax=Pseudomonas fluorescens TaxID=294 RepID=UPI003D00D8E4
MTQVAKARQVRVFSCLSKLLLAALFTLNSSAATFISKPTHHRPSNESRDRSLATPLPDHHRPRFKAAMNRPQRFRGLATDPGVQRKAPSTVIQRENKPKGPWLEEQLEIGR